jgi:hypothetical protein
MDVSSSPLWPWIVLAALGAFHGLNPAMGWLFAVALGLHRRSGATVVTALAPIALGHAVAIAAVLAAILVFGTVIEPAHLGRGAALVLLAWAAWHALAGHRLPVRIGMKTGLAGLALWSCMVAGAHGAGLMVVPALMSLCVSPGQAGIFTLTQSLPISIVALAVHTGTMLLVIAAVSLLAYRHGLGFLRRGWINLDLVWSASLVLGAVWLLAA